IEHAEDMLTWTPDGTRVVWRPTAHTEDDTAKGWLEIWGPNGGLLFPRVRAGRLSIEPARPAQDRRAVTTLRVPGAALRVLERRAFVGGRPVFMRTARSENDAHAE